MPSCICVPPGDYRPKFKTTLDETEIVEERRPWEGDVVLDTLKRESEHRRAMFEKKYFRKGYKNVPTIPPENWTIFQGDLVEVTIGKDKGKQGTVSHVIREQNAVFVEGIHTKVVSNFPEETAKRFDIAQTMLLNEQPLYVDKGQVRLVDPNDGEPCSAQWVLNDSKTAYIRISSRTGYEIPLPSMAYRTYEYSEPNLYIAVTEKDTTAEAVMTKTFRPKLCTFEQDIEEEMGLKKQQTNEEKPPTYWY